MFLCANYFWFIKLFLLFVIYYNIKELKNIFLDCPGTQSESAGKASACAECPNQSLCSSGAARQPDPGIELVKERLSSVRNKLLVLSGKGGVGKSTVTSLISRCLAANDSDRNVSLHKL